MAVGRRARGGAAARRDAPAPGRASCTTSFYGAWRPEERGTIAAAPRGGRASCSSSAAVPGRRRRARRRAAALLHLFHVSPHAAAAGGGLVGRGDGADRAGRALPRPGGTGPPQTEVFDAGSAWCPASSLLPHARRRLRTDDPLRMSVLARRFAPASLPGARRRRPGRPRSPTAPCHRTRGCVGADGRIAEGTAA